MEVFKKNDCISVRAYKGDAMTLLAMDIDKSKIKNFTGFSIFTKPPGKKGFFLFNRISYPSDILKKNNIDPKAKVTMDIAPLQIFRWVHTPSTDHNINKFIYGTYEYEITPRYLEKDILQPLDKSLTVKISIDVHPYKSGKFQIGFCRGFVESQAYARHFGLNNKLQPSKTELIFDIKQKAGPLPKDLKKNPELKPYTYEDIQMWLGWQARILVLDFLNEAKANDCSLDVFAFDLNETTICDTLIKFGAKSAKKVRIILDNSTDHTTPAKLEVKFDKAYRKAAKDPATLVRGHFGALAHSKVFILKKNGKPVKVLTGSTNFSSNGLYINANHVIVFSDPDVAALYEQVFEKSFSKSLMADFKDTDLANQAFKFSKTGIPNMAIRFSPHTKEEATNFFATINKRILAAKSDVLFAIMNDHSESSILDAVKKQINNDKVFTYGITDVVPKGKKTSILVYKPGSKRGVRVAGKPGKFVLPPPFTAEAGIPGISVHHKFVVVDFKGADPTVYCGSSNLAFGPEQRNGDNLITIQDKDAVTVFAIEAIRLVDHFQFIDAEAMSKSKKKKPFTLHGSDEADWVKKYYDPNDLMFVERTLLVRK